MINNESIMSKIEMVAIKKENKTAISYIYICFTKTYHLRGIYNFVLWTKV